MSSVGKITKTSNRSISKRKPARSNEIKELLAKVTYAPTPKEVYSSSQPIEYDDEVDTTEYKRPMGVGLIRATTANEKRANFTRWYDEFKSATGRTNEECDPIEMQKILTTVTEAFEGEPTMGAKIAKAGFDASDQVVVDAANALRAVGYVLSKMLPDWDKSIDLAKSSSQQVKTWFLERKDWVLDKLYQLARMCGGAFALWLLSDYIIVLFTSVWGMTAFTGTGFASIIYILNSIGKSPEQIDAIIEKIITEADFTAMGYEKVKMILPTIIDTLKTKRDARSIAAMEKIRDKLTNEIDAKGRIRSDESVILELTVQRDSLNADIASMKSGGGRNTTRRRRTKKTRAKKHYKKSHKQQKK
jgi:hypothetical protein